MDLLVGEDAKALKSQITVTSIRQVRSGTKITTAKVPREAAKLTVIKIGWTVAKVRPRRPKPVRCFRCHGFCHQSTKYTGTNLTGKCRRYSGARHLKRAAPKSINTWRVTALGARTSLTKRARPDVWRSGRTT